MEKHLLIEQYLESIAQYIDDHHGDAMKWATRDNRFTAPLYVFPNLINPATYFVASGVVSPDDLHHYMKAHRTFERSFTTPALNKWIFRVYYDGGIHVMLREDVKCCII